jgi:hypothetical protein
MAVLFELAIDAVGNIVALVVVANQKSSLNTRLLLSMNK